MRLICLVTTLMLPTVLLAKSLDLSDCSAIKMTEETYRFTIGDLKHPKQESLVSTGNKLGKSGCGRLNTKLPRNLKILSAYQVEFNQLLSGKEQVSLAFDFTAIAWQKDTQSCRLLLFTKSKSLLHNFELTEVTKQKGLRGAHKGTQLFFSPIGFIMDEDLAL